MAFDLASLFGGNITAPQINYNTPQGQAQIAAGGSMGAGMYNQGVKAFLPGDYNATEILNWNNASDESGRNTNDFYENTLGFGNEMRGLNSNLNNAAQQLGFDTSNYNTNNYTGLTGNFGPNQGGAMQGTDPWNYLSASSSGNMQQPGITDLYGDMNSQLQDWSRIRQASAGWDGKGDARSTAETLYHQSQPGVWDPVGASRSGVKQEHRGWAREEGADTLAALSVMMPAFGGWAGLLGQGAAGTLTAGGGLGLTGGLGSAIGTGAANALVNGTVNAALSGSGVQGLLGSLGSTGLGAAANSVMGGSGIGGLFNTANAGAALNINPLSTFQGLAGKHLGQTGTAGIKGIQGLASLYNKFS